MNGLQDLCSRRIRTAWQQLPYNGVVLVQLRVGIGVRILRGGSAVELRVVAVYSELATVVVVVVWYVPRPRVQALILLGKTGGCHL